MINANILDVGVLYVGLKNRLYFQTSFKITQCFGRLLASTTITIIIKSNAQVKKYSIYFSNLSIRHSASRRGHVGHLIIIIIILSHFIKTLSYIN
jgi:hypothetical protein